MSDSLQILVRQINEARKTEQSLSDQLQSARSGSDSTWVAQLENRRDDARDAIADLEQLVEAERYRQLH